MGHQIASDWNGNEQDVGRGICGLFETLSCICLDRLNKSTKNDRMVSPWAENEIRYSPNTVLSVMCSSQSVCAMHYNYKPEGQADHQNKLTDKLPFA